MFVMLLQRDYFTSPLAVRERQVVEQGRRESFMGVYFKNRHIGYVRDLFTPEDNGAHLETETFLRLNILGEVQPVTMSADARLDDGGRLRDLRFTLRSPFYKMRANAVMKDQALAVDFDTGKQHRHLRLDMDEAPLIPTGRRRYLVGPDISPGSTVTVPYFDPLTMTTRRSTIRYQGRDKILVSGRVRNLRAYTERAAGVRVRFWLDDSGLVIREESPAGFVFVAEPKFKAVAGLEDGGRPPELLAAVSIPVPELPPLTDRTTLTLEIDLPPGFSGTVNSGRQRLSGQRLTITRESLPPETAPVCAGHENALASTPFIQSGAPAIVTAVRPLIVPGAPLATVRRISDWLFKNIKKQPVIGLPDALGTLASRQGDCNEHAVLFAALARSAGIPARVAAGVTYRRNAFYYHAWNEVCIGGDWLSVDTVFNQIPADVGHIKLIEGGIDRQVKISALIGRLRLRPVRRQPQEESP